MRTPTTEESVLCGLVVPIQHTSHHLSPREVRCGGVALPGKYCRALFLPLEWGRVTAGVLRIAKFFGPRFRGCDALGWFPPRGPLGLPGAAQPPTPGGLASLEAHGAPWGPPARGGRREPRPAGRAGVRGFRERGSHARARPHSPRHKKKRPSRRPTVSISRGSKNPQRITFRSDGSGYQSMATEGTVPFARKKNPPNHRAVVT